MKTKTQKRLTKAKKQITKAVKNVLRSELAAEQKSVFKDATEPLMEFLEELAAMFGDPDAVIGKPPEPDHIPVPPVTETEPYGGSSGGSPLTRTNPGF